jgi:hypothetical protein
MDKTMDNVQKLNTRNLKTEQYMFWQTVAIFDKSTGHNKTTGNLSKCTMLQECAGVPEDRKREI